MNKSQDIATGIARGLAQSLPEWTGAVVVIVRAEQPPSPSSTVEIAAASTFDEGNGNALACALVLMVGADKARECLEAATRDVRAPAKGDA